MKIKILVTPKSFILYKSLLNKYKKNFKFYFVKGPINNKKRLKDLMFDKDGCIIGSEKIGKDILNNNKKIKVIARYGTNTENIDLKICKQKKIKILKLNKKINNVSVARHTVALILSITNNITYYTKISKKNIWKRKKNISPQNTTVGIIGLGNIGIKVAEILKNLEFKINYFSRSNKNIKYATYFKSIKKLVINSDILSIHLPSNDSTKKIFSNDVLKKFKDKILINTARADIFDEERLYKLLKNRYIKEAALDVFHTEPTLGVSKKIRNLDNVLSTCHASFYDEITIKNMVSKCVNSLALFFKK